MKEKQMMTYSDIAGFTNSMMIILHAGISYNEGMTIMIEDCDNKYLKEVYESINHGLETGMTFYESLQEPGVFPKYFLDMIRIGETSGRLEDVMTSLNHYYQRLHDNNTALKSALTYPLIMIAMMLIVVIVLITQVLPIFNRVFEQLGSSISGFSKVVMDLGRVLSDYAYIFIIIFILLIALYFYLTKSKNGKEKLYDFFTKLPLTKDLSLKIALSKFTSGMSIGISSGLDINDSFKMSEELVEHKALKERIQKAEVIMEESDIANALVESKVLTGMYARLIKLGYKTGGMDIIMENIATRYDQETNEQINHLMSIIEPTIVAILSVLVGLILLSVMLPLIGIMSSL